MEKTLKQIKTSLKPLVKSENLKFKHLNNEFQEILEYTDFFTLNRRKHYLLMRFVFQKRENSLCFVYRYVFNSKTTTLDETYSFSDKDITVLPGVNPIDREELRSMYNYVLQDNRIVNGVPLDLQAKKVFEVFQNNHKSIIEHARNIANIKKIPE